MPEELHDLHGPDRAVLVQDEAELTPTGLPLARRLRGIRPLVLDPPLELGEVVRVARVRRVEWDRDLALARGPGLAGARPVGLRSAAPGRGQRRRHVEAPASAARSAGPPRSGSTAPRREGRERQARSARARRYQAPAPAGGPQQAGDGLRRRGSGRPDAARRRGCGRRAGGAGSGARATTGGAGGAGVAGGRRDGLGCRRRRRRAPAPWLRSAAPGRRRPRRRRRGSRARGLGCRAAGRSARGGGVSGRTSGVPDSAGGRLHDQRGLGRSDGSTGSRVTQAKTPSATITWRASEAQSSRARVGRRKRRQERRRERRTAMEP